MAWLVALYSLLRTGVASSIGLAVVVLLLIMTTLAVTASIGVVKSCRKKSECHL